MSTLTQLREWLSGRLSILVAVGVASLSLALWQAIATHERAQVARAVEQETLTLRTEIKERIEPKILALVLLARRWELRGGTSRAFLSRN